MNITHVTVALILLATAAVSAQSQIPARDAAQLARLEQTLDPDTYRAVVRLIDGARARALPTDPLVDRALEGAMKRAPGPRIREAVSKLAQRLEVARSMLAPAPTEADIAAGAAALGVDVPKEVLRKIRSIRPTEPVAVPLGVLTELVARKVPVQQAATLVVGLIQRGATATQLVALNGDVQRDIAAGIEPGAAFDIRTRLFASTLPGPATADLLAGENTPTAPRNAPAAGGNTVGNTNTNTPRAGTPAPGPGSRRP